MSKVLQTYLGTSYDPERDWTSRLRSRSGHPPFIGDSQAWANFTISNNSALTPMKDFILKFGHSQTPRWREKLQKSHLVYHLDLVTNSRTKNSGFDICAAQIERVSRMPTIIDEVQF